MRTAKHARMLKAAFDLFVDKGYDKVTVEQIARAAGQSKGAFYWYFKDKEDCLGQILTSHSQRLDTDLTRVLAEYDTAAEQLRALTDFTYWGDPDFLKFVSMLQGLLHSRNNAVRSLARDISSKWWSNGVALTVDLARKTAKESGWSEERIRNFDFNTWFYCYLATFDGLYNFLGNKTVPPPGTTRDIAKVIHGAYVDVFTSA